MWYKMYWAVTPVTMSRNTKCGYAVHTPFLHLIKAPIILQRCPATISRHPGSSMQIDCPQALEGSVAGKQAHHEDEFIGGGQCTYTFSTVLYRQLTSAM
jgi:hypothetical protein